MTIPHTETRDISNWQGQLFSVAIFRRIAGFQGIAAKPLDLCLAEGAGIFRVCVGNKNHSVAGADAFRTYTCALVLK